MPCRPIPYSLAFLVLAALLAGGSFAACSRDGGREQGADWEGTHAEPEGWGEIAPHPEAWEGDLAAATRPLRPREGTEEDWEVLRSKVVTAWDQGWDALPMGESMVRIGLSFLGTTYVPGTLEVAGEEGVVVNLLQLDCVTFVENVLAMARFIRLADPEILESEPMTRERFTGLLREIRYRGGRVDGYPSRLHYFSEWIQDNEARGLVRDVTQELGGEVDPEAIDFMSRNPEAYRQLMDPFNLRAIREVEFRLSGQIRHKIRQEDIPARAARIRDGDIIAITSALPGLDVAHTGLAYWQDGELHLLHAPMVGEVVEVSRLPLAERIWRSDAQDGIRVARPLAP
jgi:hypothetical protein